MDTKAIICAEDTNLLKVLFDIQNLFVNKLTLKIYSFNMVFTSVKYNLLEKIQLKLAWSD